jgi:hypothetical protein
VLVLLRALFVRRGEHNVYHCKHRGNEGLHETDERAEREKYDGNEVWNEVRKDPKNQMIRANIPVKTQVKRQDPGPKKCLK